MAGYQVPHFPENGSWYEWNGNYDIESGDENIQSNLPEYNDSSIDFIVRYWTKAEQKEVRRTQTHAIIAIKKVFDRVDINIPYPIRTVYFYNQDKYNDYLPTDNEKNMKASL
ncbi:mechanosensitive ion channel family protein [Okeania sp. SIO2C2]|uniref:mechanosensitive ion channel family protein n=1 Tax=Okeania sp. SIO2C2 TaxID=2607787 RepID=UPI00257D59E2|nr:mechanosensitive ion channel family protein [Okeania sp. SIO2C2]